MSRGGTVVRWLLIVTHTLLGLSAVGAGALLLRDPSGAALTFEAEWLRGSWFGDYLVPGLFPAIVIGRRVLHDHGVCRAIVIVWRLHTGRTDQLRHRHRHRASAQDRQLPNDQRHEASAQGEGPAR